MAEVRFAPRVVTAMRRCLDEAGASGVAENQVRANVSVLAERMRRASPVERLDDLFEEAVPLVGVSSRFRVVGEYVTIYVEDRRPDEPDFLVHWIEFRRFE